jgi:large subunit ribosomal protein L29
MASDQTKASDLRGRSDEELAAFVKQKQEEYFKLRFQHFTGQLENVARMKQVRREIARGNTIRAQKARGA